MIFNGERECHLNSKNAEIGNSGTSLHMISRTGTWALFLIAIYDFGGGGLGMSRVQLPPKQKVVPKV